jgi:hypothetical protein
MSYESFLSYCDSESLAEVARLTAAAARALDPATLADEAETLRRAEA